MTDRGKYTVSVGIFVPRGTKSTSFLLDDLLRLDGRSFLLKDVFFLFEQKPRVQILRPRISKYRRARFITSRSRQGREALVRLFLKKTKGELVAIVDARLRFPPANNLLEDLLRPFISSSSLGMTIGKVEPCEATTFCAQAIASEQHARLAVQHLFDVTKTHWVVNTSWYAIRRRKFVSFLRVHRREISPFHLYFAAYSKRIDVRYVKQAVCRIPAVSSLTALVDQETEAFFVRESLERLFSREITRQRSVPSAIKRKEFFYRLISDPFGVIFLWSMRFLIYLRYHERARVVRRILRQFAPKEYGHSKRGWGLDIK